MSKNLKLFTDDASRQTYEQSQEYLEPYVGGVSSAQTASYNTQNIGKYFIDYTRTEHRLSDFDINNKDIIEVEYLESTGTQYIDTGYIPNANTGIYVKGQRVSGNDNFIIGCRNTSGNTRWAIGKITSGWYFGYGNLLSNRYDVTIGECWMNYKNSKTIKCNDSAETSLPSLSFTPAYNIRLFGSAGVNAAYTKWYGRIYAVQITQGTEIIMDLIPVRVNNVGYMYDKVSRALFSNSGTGDFVIGPDKYDAQIQYLESTGTQYIDTEFKHNQDTRFVAKFEVINNEYNQNKYLDPFGSWGDVKASSGTNYGKMKGLEWSKSSTHWHSYYGVIAKGKQLDTRIARFGIHTIDFNKRVHQMDSYSVTHDAQTFTSKYNDIIFGVTGYTGSVSYEFCFKYFYFQIYDNGTLVRDYIPVRKNNIGYMYDNVSGRLFSNAGSGQFILGPDVV